MSFIVVGLGASGKKTLARALQAQRGLEVLHANSWRYSDGDWTKVPHDEFVSSVLRAVELQQDARAPFCLESLYLDAHDPTHAREHALQAVIEAAPETAKPTVLVLSPVDLAKDLRRVIHRGMGRADGTIAQGACLETLDTLTRLVIKFVQTYAEQRNALAEFAAWACAHGCIVVEAPYDRMCAQLRLDPAPWMT